MKSNKIKLYKVEAGIENWMENKPRLGNPLDGKEKFWGTTDYAKAEKTYDYYCSVADKYGYEVVALVSWEVPEEIYKEDERMEVSQEEIDSEEERRVSRMG